MGEGLPWPATDTTRPADDARPVDAKGERPTPWSFAAVADPPLPEVKNAAWCTSPLDRFVL